MPTAETAPSDRGQVWRFDAIGTVWEIETDAVLSSELAARVRARIAAFDREWSRFREDSVVAELARTGGTVSAPRDAGAMLDTYAALADATEGAVNPLVGRSLEHLGYGPGYSLVPTDPVSAPREWRARLRWSESELALSEPAMIDVGAVGKGRLVDLVLAEIADSLDGRIVVDAGGDIAVRGGRERIGLEHPYRPGRAIGVVEVVDGAVCASATNRRAWGDGIHHVIDARTGLPVHAVAATWAFAPDAMRADAISTALFFDGGPALAHTWGVEWVRMLTDGTAEFSPGCPARLFSAAG